MIQNANKIGLWTVCELRALKAQGMGVRHLSERFNLPKRRIERLLKKSDNTTFPALPTVDLYISAKFIATGKGSEKKELEKIYQKYEKPRELEN
jgi:hypothetical protein